MRKLKYHLLLAAVLCCAGSCTNSEDVVLPLSGEQHYVMQFDAAAPDYESGSTRAAESSWEDGDQVYLCFAEQAYGVGTYSQSAQSWDLACNAGSLQAGAHATCKVYFMRGATRDGASVTMTERNPVFADEGASYSFNGSVLSLTAELDPASVRFCLKGDAGQDVAIDSSTDLQYYSSFNLSSATFGSSQLQSVPSVGADGFTGFVYLAPLQADGLLALRSNQTLYKRTIPASLFTPGASGYFSIPTRSAYTGWEKTEFATSTISFYAALPAANPDSPEDFRGIQTVAEESGLGVRVSSSVYIISDEATSPTSISYALSLVNKHQGNADRDATAAERVSPTGVYNPYECALCGVEGLNQQQRMHLFRTAQEAMPGDDEATCPDISFDNTVASFGNAQVVVRWNEEVDLRRFVEVHKLAGDDETVVTVNELAEQGMDYKFELVGYTRGQNKTSESAYAAINGCMLRPQMPQSTQAADYGTTSQSPAALGRAPLVRVSLVGADRNVYAYGYILVLIADEGVVPPAIEDKYVSYTGGNWLYVQPGFSSAVPQSFSWSVSWNDVEQDILVDALGISKAEFFQHYTPVPDPNGIGLQQYLRDASVTDKTEFRQVSARETLGVFTETVDNGEITRLSWSISAVELIEKYGQQAGTVTVDRAILYEPDDAGKVHGYPNLYVWVDNARFVFLVAASAGQ